MRRTSQTEPLSGVPRSDAACGSRAFETGEIGQACGGGLRQRLHAAALLGVEEPFHAEDLGELLALYDLADDAAVETGLRRPRTDGVRGDENQIAGAVHQDRRAAIGRQ